MMVMEVGAEVVANPANRFGDWDWVEEVAAVEVPGGKEEGLCLRLHPFYPGGPLSNSEVD